MRKILLATSLVTALIMMGCGDRGTPPEQAKISVKSATINTQTNTIVTSSNYTTVTIFGEKNAEVFINDEAVGTFPASGSLEVTIEVKSEGLHTFAMTSKTPAGVISTMSIKVLKENHGASLGTVETGGEASALTVSQDGVIFVAEKNHGVEIISIGFNDRVSSDLLATIDTTDAKNVVLSDDQKTLYIEDKAGKFHVMDISDLSNPVDMGVISKLDKSVSVSSEDARKRYRVVFCGLIGEDTSVSSDITRDFILRDRAIRDVVLVNNDTQLLVAHGLEGLQLYDIKDVGLPQLVSTKNLDGDTTGLSLIKKDDILFVANGDKGVEIFNLDILLDEMTR